MCAALCITRSVGVDMHDAPLSISQSGSIYIQLENLVVFDLWLFTGNTTLFSDNAECVINIRTFPTCAWEIS